MTRYSTPSSGGGTSEYGAAGVSGDAELKQAAREVGQHLKEGARDATEQARHSATGLLESQKSMACDKIEGFADAIRQTAESLGAKDPSIGRLVDQTADRVGSMSNYLRDHEFSDIIGEVERYARRHPAIFLGGMFLAGALAARFLKASHDRRHREELARTSSSDFSSRFSDSSDLAGGLERSPASYSPSSSAASWEDE